MSAESQLVVLRAANQELYADKISTLYNINHLRK